MTEHIELSGKLKEFLSKQLEQSAQYIRKKTRKRTIVKTLYITTTLSSILLLAALGTTAISIIIPPAAIVSITFASVALTGISSKFDFQGINSKLKSEIEKYNKLKNKLDYVLSLNGDLNSDVYKQILSEFTV